MAMKGDLRSLISSTNVHDTASVDLEGGLNLRKLHEVREDTGGLELAEKVVILCQ